MCCVKPQTASVLLSVFYYCDLNSMKQSDFCYMQTKGNP